MKKTINLSLAYAIFAMLSGVFYRELTKFLEFKNTTTLSLVHTHLFLLGMIMMLIVTLFISHFQIHESKKYKSFMISYNLGVCLTSFMLFIRGITQVMEMSLTRGLDASLSGISGIGHLLTGIGLILFFLMLKEHIQK